MSFSFFYHVFYYLFFALISNDFSRYLLAAVEVLRNWPLSSVHWLVFVGCLLSYWYWLMKTLSLCIFASYKCVVVSPTHASGTKWLSFICSCPQLSFSIFSLPLGFQGVPQLPCAKALYNYDGKEQGDLKFSKGDIIILRRQVDENWYHGEMGGVHGFFPTNFVQVIKPLPQPPPQCKALYDFELKDKEADKDCLPFSKVRRSSTANPHFCHMVSVVKQKYLSLQWHSFF